MSSYQPIKAARITQPTRIKATIPSLVLTWYRKGSFGGPDGFGGLLGS
jgi:hypothetical protein